MTNRLAHFILVLVFAFSLSLPAFADRASSNITQSDTAEVGAEKEVEIPCGERVVRDSRAQFLLGLNGELMSKSKDVVDAMIPFDDTVWLISADGITDMVMLKDETCLALGNFDLYGNITWNTEYQSLTNRPSSIEFKRSKSSSKYLIMADDLGEVNEKSLKGDAAKCFRLHSGELYVIDSNSKNYEFLYYIQIEKNVVTARKGASKKKSDQLFVIDFNNAPIKNSDSESLKHKWRILDEGGNPVLPPEGILISDDGDTPTITKREFGFEIITTQTIECR